ncbi:MAG: hypothetical protein ACI3VY_02890 [Faecousia sp.]
MKQPFSMKNMMSHCASSVNACFAAAICLIMMGAISVVSIILLLGVVFFSLIIIVLPLLLRNKSRKCTMVVSNA